MQPGSPARSVSTHEWVTSPAAEPWLAAAKAVDVTPAAMAKFRKSLSLAQVSEVFEQSRLRAKAATKFSLAERMFFTEIGLQQATDERLSSYKAGLYPDGKLADLCCGIGGDLFAMASGRDVVAVEKSARTACFAVANCLAQGIKADVRVEDASQFDLQSVRAWHVDPDRRPHGSSRTTQVELSEPNDEALSLMLDNNPHACMKLAPAAVIPDAWSHAAELEWVGLDRECRQLLARFGDLTTNHGHRTATVLNSSGAVAERLTGSADTACEQGEIGQVICEPHACVIASRLVPSLANQRDLWQTSRNIAYLTGDHAAQSPALAVFDVQELMPFDLRRVKAALARRRWGRLEIKRRGVPYAELQPETLAQRLRVQGDDVGTLILFPIGNRLMAVMARRRMEG